MLSDEEIRLECVKEAVKLATAMLASEKVKTITYDIASVSKEMYAFVTQTGQFAAK